MSVASWFRKEKMMYEYYLTLYIIPARNTLHVISPVLILHSILLLAIQQTSPFSLSEKSISLSDLDTTQPATPIRHPLTPFNPCGDRQSATHLINLIQTKEIPSPTNRSEVPHTDSRAGPFRSSAGAPSKLIAAVTSGKPNPISISRGLCFPLFFFFFEYETGAVEGRNKRSKNSTRSSTPDRKSGILCKSRHTSPVSSGLF